MAETWSVQELLAAGWRASDLAWEEATVRAAAAVAQSDYIKANDEAGQVLQLARDEFESIDPRLGTSLVNYGLSLNLSGRSGDDGSVFLFREGLVVWRGADQWIARMEAPRVARSSLFHMRMEARHRDTYRARWQERWREIAAEARTRIEALVGSANAELPTPDDVLPRWHRERPAMLNDTRKLMAAAFLLLAPGDTA